MRLNTGDMFDIGLTHDVWVGQDRSVYSRQALVWLWGRWRLLPGWLRGVIPYQLVGKLEDSISIEEAMDAAMDAYGK